MRARSFLIGFVGVVQNNGLNTRIWGHHGCHGLGARVGAARCGLRIHILIDSRADCSSCGLFRVRVIVLSWITLPWEISFSVSGVVYLGFSPRRTLPLRCVFLCLTREFVGVRRVHRTRNNLWFEDLHSRITGVP